jgi:hypothetical protein
MKNMKTCLFYLGLSLFSSLSFSEDKIEIILEQPISIGKSNTAVGVLGSLSPDAIQQGIDNARIKGAVKYQKLADSKVRVSINWSSLIKQNGVSESNIPLDKNLLSQFVTASANIEPKVTVMAQGDLTAFAESINELMSTEKFVPSPVDEEQTTTSNKKVNSESGGDSGGVPMYSDDSGGSSGSSNVEGSDGGTNANQQNNVTVKSENWELCTDRIDGTSGQIFPRAKKVVTDGNGSEIERGSCEDHGEPRAIGTTVEWESCISDYDNTGRLIYEKAKKIVTNEFNTEISRGECERHGKILEMEVDESWGGCDNLIDQDDGFVYARGMRILKNDKGEELERGDCTPHGEIAEIKKVYGNQCVNLNDYINLVTYPSYRKYANIGAKELMIAPCTADVEKAIELVTDSSACSIRHDFINGFAVQQWKYFYVENGENVDATDCLDSSIQYTYYKTTIGCTAVIDTVNNIVFPSKRSAYKVLDGTINYASECAPVDSDSVSLKHEYCAQKYEHDLVAGQSYKRIKSYYNDFSTGQKIFASDCVRDTTISYLQTQETQGCGYENNDSGKYSVLNAKKQITTEEDGIIVISDCQQVGNKMYYALYNNETDKLVKVADNCTYYVGHDNQDYRPDCSRLLSSLVGYPNSYGCHKGYSYDSRDRPQYLGMDQYKLYDNQYYRRGDGSTYLVSNYKGMVCGPDS